MSVDLTVWARAQSPHIATTATRFVLWAICFRADNDAVLRVPMTVIAEDTALEISNVRKHIKRLEDDGLLVRENGKTTINTAYGKQAHVPEQAPVRRHTCLSEQAHVPEKPRTGASYKDKTREDSKRDANSQFDYIKISKRLLEVAGSCVRSMAISIQDISPIVELLKRGASLEDHVLPAIREIRDRDDGKLISSWAYFREPILARLERTEAALRELKRIELETSPNPPRSEPDPDYVPYPNEMPNPDGIPAASRNQTLRPEPVREDRDDLSEVFAYAETVKSQKEGSRGLDRPKQHSSPLHPLRMDGTRMDGGIVRSC